MKFVKILGAWLVIAFIIACLFSMNDFALEPVDPNAVSEEGVEPEKQMKQVFIFVSLGISFVLTLGGILVMENNRIQKIKARIPSLEGDVAALNERRTHQLEQANKVLDKYLAHESSIQTAMAGARVDNGSKFKAIIESYPELSGNQAVHTLMDQITQVEKELVNRKYQLNDCISVYNGAINSFPISLFRKLFGLEEYVIKQENASEAVQDAISDEELGI